MCMYGQAQETIPQAPHCLGTDDESCGKTLLGNMAVYSKYISGNCLPGKYHEFCVSVLLLLFQILTDLERILGHRLVPNLKVSVNPVSERFARPVADL